MIRSVVPNTAVGSSLGGGSVCVTSGFFFFSSRITGGYKPSSGAPFFFFFCCAGPVAGSSRNGIINNRMLRFTSEEPILANAVHSHRRLRFHLSFTRAEQVPWRTRRKLVDETRGELT